MKSSACLLNAALYEAFCLSLLLHCLSLNLLAICGDDVRCGAESHLPDSKQLYICCFVVSCGGGLVFNLNWDGPVQWVHLSAAHNCGGPGVHVYCSMYVCSSKNGGEVVVRSLHKWIT